MKNKKLRKNDISRAYVGNGIDRPQSGPSTKKVVNGIAIITPFKSNHVVDKKRCSE